MSAIQFRMAARCESAGRPNNEDNYQLSENLSENSWGFNTDAEIPLGEKGCLLVVADGMGGMNAGEVASALAVETIKERFASESLTSEIISSPETIRKYIELSVIEADTRVKQESSTDPEKEGMGSTIVLAWLINKTLYVGWCGDSRAYRFNPEDGLVQLSHDHSYVQELVDAGKLKEEYAFDHPDNNIITRSLGDPRRKAKPDIREYSLRDGDIILLCSDGLSGVLRDSEIESILRANTDGMGACRDALWNAAEEAGWHDNVTIALCQILSGAGKVVPNEKGTGNVRKTKKLFFSSFIIVALLLGIIAGYLINTFNNNRNAFDGENNGLDSEVIKEFIALSIQLGNYYKEIPESESYKLLIRRKLYPRDSIDNDSIECHIPFLMVLKETHIKESKERIQKLKTEIEAIRDTYLSDKLNRLATILDSIKDDSSEEFLIRDWNTQFLELEKEMKLKKQLPPQPKEKSAGKENNTNNVQEKPVGGELTRIQKNEEDITLISEDEYILHTVKTGETLFSIVKHYNSLDQPVMVTVERLQEINQKEDPDKLTIGEIIKIPTR